ncbi:MAG TPA: glycosyltransferase family 4 protein [Dermatophilaceae bacterium]|nr:glycosyltransferase family 4 protein [Dermatophilaceae bacterium]
MRGHGVVAHSFKGILVLWTAAEPTTRLPRRPLHIAMIGQKGLPATYGGIEHVVSETGRRLADRGHRVTVFTRASYGTPPPSPYLGMDVVPAPTVASKHLDAIVHSATSTAKALRMGCDVFHYHALGPGLVAPVPRYLSRSKVALTVHGLDHQRGKWGLGARAVLGTAHWMSSRVPDRTIVVSRALQEHYRTHFGRSTEYIPNGVSLPEPAPAAPIEAFGLTPGRYVLFVGRIVPEKAPDLLVEAFGQVTGGDVQLAVVGDTSWTDGFTDRVRELAARDPRVVLTGYAFGETLRALYQHAGVFVQPSYVEGLPLTLLEAISHGLPVLTSDIPPHVEVIGSDGGPARRTFRTGDVGSLARALQDLVGGFDTLREPARAFRDQIMGDYDWDSVTDQLEQVYLQLTTPAARVARVARAEAVDGRPV